MEELLEYLQSRRGIGITPIIQQIIKNLADIISDCVTENSDKRLFECVISHLTKLERILSPGLALEIFGRLHHVKKTEIPRPSGVNLFKPNSLDEITKKITMRLQENKNLEIKAVGTGHSLEWTDIGKTNGLTIDMSNLNDVIEINRATLNDLAQGWLDDRMICCFESGATLEHIQDYLWPKEFRKTKNPGVYRILPNQTGCPNLSLCGTVATAAHGNGLTKPIIADMVESFRMICIEENTIKQYQIEKTVGLSNRKSFETEYPDVQLEQDDDTFYACLVNLGGMGITFSYILHTERAYYLTENRIMLPLKEAESEITSLFYHNREKIPNLHSFEIFVNPYPVNEETQVVLLTLAKANGPPKGERPDWHLIPHDFVQMGITLACEWMPKIVPFLLSLLMKATCTSQPVTMDAVEALNPLSGLAVSGQVVVSECTIEAQDGKDVIDRIEALTGFYKGIKDTQLATAPFAVRFSQASPAYMAMQYNRQSMMIISNILRGTPKADNTLKRFRDFMMKEYKGRPHWGMVHDIESKQLLELYPEDAISTFKRIREKYDKAGHFTNEFITRVFQLTNM